MTSRYRESRIANLPPVERIERVKARLRRRVYHRLMGDYAGGGHDLFNVTMFAEDLSLGVGQLYDLGFVVDREDCGWKLPAAPEEAKFAEILMYLIAKAAPLTT